MIWQIGVIGASLIGLVLVIFQLPGTWLILAAAAGYAWQSEWHDISKATVVILAALALLGELVELLATWLGARRVGASRRSMWFGLLGGFGGMLLLTIPIPVIGTLAGAIIGCFIGAAIGEMMVRDDLAGATKVGVVTAISRAFGTIAKLALALAMTALVIASLFL
ncbi:MAG: DUF456 domain-containing protein [Phycisphaerae bacterium]